MAVPADSAHSPHSCGGTASAPTLPAPPPGAARTQRRSEPRYRGEKNPRGAKGGDGAGCGRERATGSAEARPQPRYPPLPPSGPPPRPPPPVTTAVFLALVMPPGRCAGPRRKEAAAPTLRATHRGARGARSPSSFRYSTSPKRPRGGGGGGLCVYWGWGGSGEGPARALLGEISRPSSVMFREALRCPSRGREGTERIGPELGGKRPGWERRTGSGEAWGEAAPTRRRGI